MTDNKRVEQGMPELLEKDRIVIVQPVFNDNEAIDYGIAISFIKKGSTVAYIGYKKAYGCYQGTEYMQVFCFYPARNFYTYCAYGTYNTWTLSRFHVYVIDVDYSN